LGNAGMDTIAKLTTLEAIELDHTKLADAGIAKLAGLAKLTDLLLDSVELTEAADRGERRDAASVSSTCITRW
ncbi:MAG TPA: hypothetical protein VNG89_05505, partial [Vicinamibacterales bacterium]|nr:hypothetical protein [Vicinamibacterales bacterium]